jgi:hypothetical protein
LSALYRSGTLKVAAPQAKAGATHLIKAAKLDSSSAVSATAAPTALSTSGTDVPDGPLVPDGLLVPDGRWFPDGPSVALTVAALSAASAAFSFDRSAWRAAIRDASAEVPYRPRSARSLKFWDMGENENGRRLISACAGWTEGERR